MHDVKISLDCLWCALYVVFCRKVVVVYCYHVLLLFSFAFFGVFNNVLCVYFR